MQCGARDGSLPKAQLALKRSGLMAFDECIATVLLMAS